MTSHACNWEEGDSLVSVIIPMRDAAPYVCHCLESVCGQSYGNLEIIVVDDGSSDGSDTLVGDFGDPRVKLVRGEGKGAAAARNIGLEAAKGQWIQFLDADDVLEKDKIRTQLALLARSGGGIAACKWCHFRHEPGDLGCLPEPDWAVGSGVDFLIESLSGGGMYQTACWLTSRKLIDLAGLWNEELSLHDDGEFFARVLVHAPMVQVHPAVGVHYRKVAGSLSSRRNSRSARSALSVCKLRGDALIGADGSAKAKVAVATSLLQVAYEFQESTPDVANEALACLQDIGATPLPIVGGALFRWATRLCGATRAMQARGFCKGIIQALRRVGGTPGPHEPPAEPPPGGPTGCPR